MSINARLVIMPVWLLRSLEADGLSRAHVLDVTSLARILSVNDVAFYVALNEYLFDKMPKAIRQTFMSLSLLNNTHAMPDNHGNVATTEAADALCARLRRKVDEYYMAEFQDPKEINPRHLIDKLAYHEISNNSDRVDSVDQYLFEVVLLKDDIYGITFKPHDPETALGGQLVKSYDDLLRLLQGIHGFTNVAGTEAFSEYVNLMRRAA